MNEPIESDEWVDLDVDLPPALVQRICADAARNGLAPSEQLVHELLRDRELIRPSLTH